MDFSGSLQEWSSSELKESLLKCFHREAGKVSSLHSDQEFMYRAKPGKVLMDLPFHSRVTCLKNKK